MKCKDLTHKIDSGEALTQEELDHIRSCPSCKRYKASHKALETDLEDLFTEKDGSEFLDAKLLKAIPRKYNLLNIAAALLITVLIITNPLFIAFAEKLPFVAEIMQFLERDEEIELAIQQDLPVYDYIEVTDQYKLLVKDLYVDKYKLKMQISVLDENYDIADEAIVMVDAPKLLSEPIEFRLGLEEEWHELDERLYLDYISYQGVDVTIRISDGEEIVIEKKIQLDTAHLRDKSYTTYEVNESIELEKGSLKIESLKLGKTDMSIAFRMPSIKNAVFGGVTFYLRDNLGNVYRGGTSTYTVGRDDYEGVAVFDNLIFNPAAEYFDLTVDALHYEPVIVIPNVQGEDEFFDYKGNRYRVIRSTNRGNLSFTLAAEEELLPAQFPRIFHKDGGFWRSAILRRENIPATLITQEDFLKVYGTLDKPVTDMKPMLDYVKKTKDIDLNKDHLATYINLLLTKPSISIVNDVKTNELIYDTMQGTYAEPEKQIIGYLADKEWIIIDKTIRIELQE